MYGEHQHGTFQARRASATNCTFLPHCRAPTNMGLLLLSAIRPTPWAISRRRLATVAEQRKAPQTVIEKIVQKYAVGLPAGKQVKAGDYVMIRPEHVMTHDNTGPVIGKFVVSTLHIRSVQLSYLMVFLGSSLSGRRR